MSKYQEKQQKHMTRCFERISTLETYIPGKTWAKTLEEINEYIYYQPMFQKLSRENKATIRAHVDIRLLHTVDYHKVFVWCHKLPENEYPGNMWICSVDVPPNELNKIVKNFARRCYVENWQSNFIWAYTLPEKFEVGIPFCADQVSFW